MESTPDPSICPSCGAPNTCGMSQGKSECWCFSVSIPKAALERIPAQAKGLACLCPRCAAFAGEPAPSAESGGPLVPHE